MRWNITRKATESPCGRGTRPPRARGLRPIHGNRSVARGLVPRPPVRPRGRETVLLVVDDQTLCIARVLSRALGSPGALRGVVRSPTVRKQEPSMNPGKPEKGAGQPASILVVD